MKVFREGDKVWVPGRVVDVSQWPHEEGTVRVQLLGKYRDANISDFMPRMVKRRKPWEATKKKSK